jgi:hypothetical protein
LRGDTVNLFSGESAVRLTRETPRLLDLPLSFQQPSEILASKMTLPGLTRIRSAKFLWRRNILAHTNDLDAISRIRDVVMVLPLPGLSDCHKRAVFAPVF